MLRRAQALQSATFGSNCREWRLRPSTSKLTGMTCAACAARIEKVLNRVDGVRAEVNFATESAHVVFDRGKATTDDADRGRAQRRLRRGAGGRSLRATGRGGDGRGEALPARASGVRASPRSSRCRSSRRWRRWRSAGMRSNCRSALQFALATPIQFWAGARFYAGAWKALRGGSANMDVLIALGTTAAFAYSVAVWLLRAARPARLFRGGRRRDHPRAARQAARAARACPHRACDPRSLALAAGDGAVRARRRNA